MLADLVLALAELIVTIVALLTVASRELGSALRASSYDSNVAALCGSGSSERRKILVLVKQSLPTRSGEEGKNGGAEGSKHFGALLRLFHAVCGSKSSKGEIHLEKE